MSPGEDGDALEDAMPVVDAGIRVVHVDDSRDMLDVASAALEETSDRLTVETATSPQKALGCLESGVVDCIVSDYQMPEMDGLAFLSAVRDRKADVPFILFTGKGSEEIAARAISAGAEGYLQKKGTLDHYTVLANRIETLVDRHRMQQHARQSIQALEAARDGIAVFDSEGRFQYLNGAYRKLYGYESGELIGETWEHLYPAGEVESYRNDILPELHSDGGWIGECECLRSDGTVFRSEHSLSQLEDGGHVCVIHHGSVTEQ